MLDPERKFFKHRFYNEHCVSNDDGEIIKNMTVLEDLIKDPVNPQNPQQLSFSERINKSIGYPLFGEGAFASAGLFSNNGQFTLSRNLTK